jgi:FtsP/CotA-like multicopper oxidase with cupredoxin domain
MKSKIKNSRRQVLGGMAAAALATSLSTGFAKSRRRERREGSRSDSKSRRLRRETVRKVEGASAFGYTKFSQPLLIPPVKKPISRGTPPWEVGKVFHGVAPEYFDRRVAEEPSLYYPEKYPESYYEVHIKEFEGEVFPNVKTPCVGYDGISPGPTFHYRGCEPVVVRMHNHSHHELSTHLHGGHNPSHGDGYPNFFILPGRARDYYYTNTIPYHHGQPDVGEAPSTMWYHDHGMDVTAETCLQGLFGFAIQIDDFEQNLIDRKVLPGAEEDIVLGIADRRFNSDGTIAFDPLDHNGYLGDVYTVNGRAFPYFKVQRRKYRLRFLNASNARHVELRLSNGQPFVGIANDSWLLPRAISRDSILLSPAKRADVIVDFTNAPEELFLENILRQDDGRGPSGKLDRRDTEIPGENVMKFVVEGDPPVQDCSIKIGDELREHIPILPSEIEATRVFEFHRRKGAWQINNEFFDEFKSNACPRVGSAERWILRNGSGGWWHPIHIHLESHQIQSIDGRKPPAEWRYKSDVAMLGPNTEVELFMKFRTFTGPFVFHCHNLEHEDMRMMFVFDPIKDGPKSNQPLSAFYP